MRSWIAGWSLLMVLAGCATAPSTVESRRKERAAEYQRLSADEKTAVDQGRIREGMSLDAAYIAWGKPSRIISEGSTTTWLYEVSELKEQKSMTVRTMPATPLGVAGANAQVEETSTLYPHLITKAKIVFLNGRAKEWQRYDKPAY